MASSPIASWQIDGKTVEIVRDFILGGSKITADGDCSHEIKRHLLLERQTMINLNSILKTRDITFPKNVHLIKAIIFPIVTFGCELDHKKEWVPNYWCFQISVLEKTLESSLDYKEIQLVNPSGIQPWIFIERTDSEFEVPILWPPDAKSWKQTNKQKTKTDPGKHWRQEEKGTTEDEMVGWYHQLSGHAFEQTLGDDEGQGSLPGVLQSMKSQSVGHALVPGQQQQD